MMKKVKSVLFILLLILSAGLSEAKNIEVPQNVDTQEQYTCSDAVLAFIDGWEEEYGCMDAETANAMYNYLMEKVC